MSDWIVTETNTHQDHVIAHVIGTTVKGYFVWDETAFLLLDIGFIWNIYLDGEMGLLPQSMAISELEAPPEIQQELRVDLDQIERLQDQSSLNRMTWSGNCSAIESVEFETSGNSRRFIVACEERTLVVETSLETKEVKILEF